MRRDSTATPVVAPDNDRADDYARTILEDGLLSVKGACAFLGTGKTFVYQAMADGEIAYVVLGRKRLLPKRALIEYAARNLKGGSR
jgi:excisionase family DNA binding protein